MSFVKPHHPVKTSSVLRWFKAIIAEAVINTNQFKTNSTRIKAYFTGESVLNIMHQAHWANKSTFATYTQVNFQTISIKTYLGFQRTLSIPSKVMV